MLRIGSKNLEKVVNLGSVKLGEIFRFVSQGCFATALSNGSIYLRINSNNGDKRVYCCSVDGKEVRLFDEEHQVIVHSYDLVIFPA